MEYLATRGYDPAFGARPVKRVVQQELETALAKGILRGDFAVRPCRKGWGEHSICACCVPPRASSASALRLHHWWLRRSHLPLNRRPLSTQRPQEDDTIVVEAPGGAQATHLTLYRKGGDAAHGVHQGDNAAELRV